MGNYDMLSMTLFVAVIILLLTFDFKTAFIAALLYVFWQFIKKIINHLTKDKR